MYRNLFGTKPLIKEIHLGGGTPNFFSAAHLKILLDVILLNKETHPNAHFSLEAQPLADDGLIALNSRELKVTPLGKKYLRNICLALNARLWADKPGKQLFSMAI